MRDRQDHDEAGLQRRIAGGDETGRAVLTLVAADRGLPQPQVIVSDNKAGPRLRHRHGRRLLHQLVERRMLTVHLGACDNLDRDRRRVSGPMGPSGGCHEPVGSADISTSSLRPCRVISTGSRSALCWNSPNFRWNSTAVVWNAGRAARAHRAALEAPARL